MLSIFIKLKLSLLYFCSYAVFLQDFMTVNDVSNVFYIAGSTQRDYLLCGQCGDEGLGKAF